MSYGNHKHQDNHHKRKHNHHKNCNKLIVELISDLDFDYRKDDGYGNNKNHPTWGKAGEQLLRTAPSSYTDGKSEPSGKDRPSARVISNEIFSQTKSVPNPQKASNIFWLHGQILDHLLDLTPEENPTQSFNILVPTGDPYFDPLSTGTQVIPLNRSIYDPNTGLVNPRQQINLITSFIDCSNIYGSDEHRNKYCRHHVNGKMSLSEGKMLPYNNGTMNNAGGKGTGLYVAGDIRANENLALTAMHTLWVREHNYWAELLKEYNPCETDENIYQKARAIVEAEFQVITYNEFLPLLLGNKMQKYNGYNKNVNPSISNEFSTAAYRLGHSLVSKEFKRLDNNGKEIWAGNISLRDAYFSPWKLTNEGGIDPILKGMASGLAEKLDSKVIDDLRNFLFGAPGKGGLDLVSLNIQRGRDHGLADYNTTRESYGLKRVVSFDQITSNNSTVRKLKMLYENVDDIDLWVGILVEDPVSKGMTGELCTAIIKDQFERVRDGDRFWYEHRFPKKLRRLLRKTKLSDIIRRNTGIKNLQENVMLLECDCKCKCKHHTKN